MRYCEKYGRMDCELEKLGVEAPHQPCYKAFVDYCLSNLLEIASGGYSTMGAGCVKSRLQTSTCWGLPGQ